MNAETPPKLVKSAIRTVNLFAVFAEARRPLTLAEVAERMAAPKSSCYELIQTFVHQGYMFALDDGKSYYPSRRLYEMAAQINAYNPIKQKIEERLRRLRDTTGETVMIGRFQGKNVVYTEVFDGTHSIRYTARSGDLKSVHASALGKALLSALDEDGRKRTLASVKLTRYNDNTITDKKALAENLAQGEAQGVYTTVGEHLPDVMGMALPLQVQGYLLAVGLAGPLSRMEQHFATYAEALREVIRELS